MASPRLETFCCPNRDAATDFIINFQPGFFTAMCAASAGLSMIFSVLQVLPKRRGYRRLGTYPLPKPASSSRILFIISVCDILGCVGKEGLVHLTAAAARGLGFLFSLRSGVNLEEMSLLDLELNR